MYAGEVEIVGEGAEAGAHRVVADGVGRDHRALVVRRALPTQDLWPQHQGKGLLCRMR